MSPLGGGDGVGQVTGILYPELRDLEWAWLRLVQVGGSGFRGSQPSYCSSGATAMTAEVDACSQLSVCGISWKI